jgi:transcriptional regulator with XRE-family HTH domain
MEDEELPAVFGVVIRELRLARGFSQERFAAKAGIDRAYMGGLERGLRNPSLTTIARVARGLELQPSDVLKAVEKRGRSDLRATRRK